MSDYTSWTVGMEVECVDDDFSDIDNTGEESPTAGVVYTIRGFDCAGDALSIYLEEIKNYPRWYVEGGFGECCFKASRFRPVQTRKTDISIFTAMLTPSPKQRERV